MSVLAVAVDVLWYLSKLTLSSGALVNGFVLFVDSTVEINDSTRCSVGLLFLSNGLMRSEDAVEAVADTL